MKKIQSSSGKIAKSSHSKSVFIEHKEAPSVDVTGSYVIPNRWAVESKKGPITSGSQASSDEVNVNDFGSENFINRAAASQTDIDRFQETRIKSPLEIKKRALESLERSEQERKERWYRETDAENDSD